MIKIDRSNHEQALKSMNTAVDTIKHGVSVVVFPEGTRGADGKLQTFKKGGFVMAIESGVPIVPVIISGARAIMTKGKFRVNPGQIRLSIQKPIDTTIYSLDTKEALMERVRRVICDNFEPIDMGERPC